MVEIILHVPDLPFWDSVFLTGDSAELGRRLSTGVRGQRRSGGSNRFTG